MSEPEKSNMKSTKMKGGGKGGARFPHLNLKDALDYSKKLVSKTFNSPQPEAIVLVGVFNNKGPRGGVRASALKQYGLMEGDTNGYYASDRAKKIETVVPEERRGLIADAFLSPKIFKQMYDTLQPDKVTRAKVRQVAANAGVHVDNLDECVGFFIDGAIEAGLGQSSADGIDLSAARVTPRLDSDAFEQQSNQSESDGAEGVREPPSNNVAGTQKENGDSVVDSNAITSGRANKPQVTLALTVDATSDPEKLEKQLKLLRQFGVI